MQSNGSPLPTHSFIPNNSGFHISLATLCVLCGSLSLILPTQREREREVVLMIMDDSINGGGTEQLLCRNHLQEGIILLLSHWYALQMALKNHWGGSDSLQKFHQLAADLFSLFSKSNAPVPVDDLENLLHESMLLSFNTEIEDGSIEEVAEQLVAIHEEYLLHQSS